MNWPNRVYNWLKYAQEWLYPSTCFLCGQPSHDSMALCNGCLADLPRNDNGCHCCGSPLSSVATVCGPCSSKPQPMKRSYAPLRYAPPVDYMLQQMKFHQKLELIPLMADLIAESVSRREGELPQVLLPVPLHHTRLKERGYNQALELAREISGRLGIPVDWQTCRRQRNTLAQTSLQGKERRSNLKGAFESLGALPSHVAIIDDVVTTGATVQEFAKTLRQAGVETVEVWACARAGAER